MTRRPTARRLIDHRLVVASHNPGKVREIGVLIAPFRIEAISAASLGLPEPEEPDPTFAGNALIKARAAAEGAQLPALADDSGICVVALNGQPGVLSARWAGPEKNFNMAMNEIHRRMMASGSSDRRAHFICALAIAWPDGHAQVFEGRVDGTLVWPPRGTKGFGYDPIFVADGETVTFGELEPEKKHAMSHRARAFKQFVDACLV